MSELYEVTLTQTYFGVQTVNRWNYRFDGTLGVISGSLALANALGAVESLGTYDADKLMRKIAAAQCNAVTFQQLTVLNLYNPVDFYQVPFVVALHGDDSGEGSPPFNALGFRTTVVRRDVARGTKRFVGVTEASVNAGGVLASGLITAGNALAVEMSASQSYVDEGTTLTFIPAVCGKEKYEVEVDGVPTGRFAYRYYQDKDDQLAKTATGFLWQLYSTVRSQTTRQYGRGT